MQDRLKPLVSLPFIICLVLLMLNDFFLKATFHNALTGKLSDVCGLFIFPIFWSVLFPERKRWCFILTGILFIYWKSELSSPLIEFVSTYIFRIQRVVDPTDLLALPVLVPAWFTLSGNRAAIKFGPLFQRLGPYFIAVVTFFSFCATTQQRYFQAFDQPQYVLLKSHILPDSNATSGNFRLYKFDTLLVVEVYQFITTRRPEKDDDYHKNFMIRDLDKDVLNMLPGVKGLVAPGKVTVLTIKTPDYEDHVRFNGSRLDGRFIRKKGEKLIIEGFYKAGIEDSTWTFRDTTSTGVTRTTFVNGEQTRVKQFQGDKLISSSRINTRADTVRNKYIQIAVLVLLLAGTVVLLVRNRRIYHEQLKIKLVFKILLSLFLPIVVWLAQLGITLLLGAYNEDIFKTIAMILLIFIATCPLFFIIFFWIKPRRDTDILLYCLLFALAISILKEYDIVVALSA